MNVLSLSPIRDSHAENLEKLLPSVLSDIADPKWPREIDTDEYWIDYVNQNTGRSDAEKMMRPHGVRPRGVIPEKPKPRIEAVSRQPLFIDPELGVFHLDLLVEYQVPALGMNVEGDYEIQWEHKNLGFVWLGATTEGTQFILRKLSYLAYMIDFPVILVTDMYYSEVLLKEGYGILKYENLDGWSLHLPEQ